MKSEIKSQSQQLYELLVGTNDTYAQIGVKMGMTAPTVAKKAREIVKQYGLNPSILRTSKNIKMYAKYCHEIKCHQLLYTTAADIKQQLPFYCSERCRHGYEYLPIKQDLVAAYKRMSFEDMAKAYDLSLGMLARLFEQYNIQPEEFPESVLVVPAHIVQRRSHRTKSVQKSGYAGTRGGFRQHLGYTVRSTWENNFCLYLNHKGITFEYEPRTFTFPEARGARSYVPDYKMIVNGQEVWCEVKGRHTADATTKMRRMKKYYPEVFAKMTYVCEKPGCKADIAYKKLGLQPFMYYNDLVKEYSSKLKYWE